MYFSKNPKLWIERTNEQDANFASCLRTLPALAFVPVDRLIEAFEVLCDSDIIPPDAVEVINYIENM